MMDDPLIAALQKAQDELDPLHFTFCCRVADAWGYWPVDLHARPVVQRKNGFWYAYYKRFGVRSQRGITWEVVRRDLPHVVDGEPLAFSAALVRAYMYDTCGRAFPQYKPVEHEVVEKAWIAR